MAEAGSQAVRTEQGSDTGVTSRALATKIFETLPQLGRMMRREQLNGTGDYQRIHMLKHLAHGPLPQAKLAEHLQMNPSALSKLIYSLEKKGYVTQTIDPEDRRRMVIALTEDGQSFQRMMLAQRVEQVNHLMKTLTPEERVTLSGALDIVTKLIENDHREER